VALAVPVVAASTNSIVKADNAKAILLFMFSTFHATMCAIHHALEIISGKAT
jgi:hypothetical protein